MIQKEGLEKFKSLPKRDNGTVCGTICLSTGTGKSKIAIDFIKETKDIQNVLITSPRTNLKENWRKELIKWGFEQWTGDSWITKQRDGTLIRIVIENIQTVYKWKKAKFDFIVADEIHTMMTPEYSKAFDNIGYKYLMGLTATHDISDKTDKGYYYAKYAPIIYEYYDSADHGLINKTRFFIVNHNLSDKFSVVVGKGSNRFYQGEKARYEYLTKQMKKGQQLMLAQGSSDWFRDAGNWFWKNNGTPEQKMAAMRYLNAIRYRKEFLLKLSSTASISRIILKGILTEIPDSKVLVFSELTDQVENIISTTVHSHNKDELNQERIDHFNSGRIRALGSCQSLTLGLNLKGATHGIMESYVGSATRSKQKKGRLDRLPTDEVADMWFIRIPGTQSDKWFEQMTKDFDLSDAIELNSDIIINNEFDFKTSTVKVQS